MSIYGEKLDDFNPNRLEVYNLFNTYFENPIMTKIQDTEKFSTYANKLYCLLSKECRYLIVIMYRTIDPIGTQTNLTDIEWVSFQTRTLTNSYKCNNHSFTTDPSHIFASSIIERQDISKEATTYSCLNLPLNVTLLHTKNKTVDSYQPKGSLMLALETYETVVTFT